MGKDNLYTLLPQIVSIFFGTLTLLLVPRMLEPVAYSQIVFWNVILSFLMLSDLGLSNVYSRKLPALLRTSKFEEAEELQSTTAVFAIAGSFIFALVASGLFYTKFESVSVAFLIFLAAMGSTCSDLASGFFISNKDYKKFCFLSVTSSLFRLSVIPAVYFYGLHAWFIVMVVIYLGVSVYFFRNFYISIHRFRMELVRRYVLEGFFLLAITLLWSQIFSLPRLSASVFYPDGVLARYGLLTAVFSIISGMTIAYFVPVTREIYAMYGDNASHAVEYVFNLLHKIQPLSVAVFIMAFFAAPLLNLLFPKYGIDPLFFRVMCLSIFFLPLLCSIGSLYVAATRGKLYLIIILISLTCTGMLFFLSNGEDILPAIALPLCTFIFSSLMVLFLPSVVEIGKRHKNSSYVFLMKNTSIALLGLILLLADYHFKFL